MRENQQRRTLGGAPWLLPVFLVSFVSACSGTMHGLQRGPWASAPVASAATAASDGLDDALPVSPELHRGVLPNGLHYYVVENKTPAARAVLRLVVDAGSVLEDDDQLGLAHVVEHMAFNGTTHYPGTALVSYLESIGMKFGAHVNAATGFDSTVFDLVVPTDDGATLEEGMRVLREWATEISFSEEEVNKERGVVLEEWRRSRGAGGRMRDRTRPITYAGSHYADRAPIGTEDSLRNFKVDALRRFYRDWYRPDLMAVVAVGDFAAESIVPIISALFGDIEPPANPRPRPRPAVPQPLEVGVGVFADPEVTRASIAWMTKIADIEGGTLRDYRNAMVERLGIDVVNEYLYEQTQKPDSPLLGAMVAKRRLTPTTSAVVAHAAVPDAAVAGGMAELLKVLEGFRRFGGSEGALQRAKRRLLAFIESAQAERHHLNSRIAADELVRAFLNGEAVPGLDYELALTRRFTEEISNHDVHDWLSQIFGKESGRTVTVVEPQRAGVRLMAEQEIRDLLAQIREKELEPPPTETTVGEGLMAGVPMRPGGTIVEETQLEDLEVERLRLSNGIVVLLKPTPYRADQVYLRAEAWGGHGAADDGVFREAEIAAAVTMASGVGDFDAAALSRMMAGRRASASVWVSESTHGVSGRSARAELETLFQLAYLRLMAPRFDEDAFDRLKRSRAEAVKNRDAAPGAAITDARVELLWGGHPRRKPWDEEAVAGLRLEAVRQFFVQHARQIDGMVVTLVGAFDPQEAKPLVARYFGALPVASGKEQQGSARVPLRLPGNKHEVVHRGIEPKAQISLTFHGPFDGGRAERYRLNSMAQVLERQLREELREDRGGTYSVGVRTAVEFRPVGAYELQIGFGCAPDRAEELKKATLQIIERVRQGKFPIAIVDDLKTQQRRGNEERLRKNGFWVRALSSAHLRGEDPTEILRYDDLVDALSSESIAAVARRYLDDRRLVAVTLLPAGARGEMVRLGRLYEGGQ